MRKSTLFISAALTAFMLAVLFGVASAYQNIVASTQAVEVFPTPQLIEAAPVAPLPEPILIPTAIPAPTEIPNVTPEQAAALASSVIGRTDLYSVEVTQLDGADVYLVTFSSRDLVYVSLQGQVVSISKLPVVVVTQPSRKGGKSNKGGGEEGGGEGGDGGDDD